MSELEIKAVHAAERAHVGREILDNRVKSSAPRIIDMIDGLLSVVESLGDASESRRARAARLALTKPVQP